MSAGLSRFEFFAGLGRIRVVDPLTDEAYRRAETEIHKGDLDSSPHGSPWHTSFHASKFPGDDERACGRYAVYSLMNVPEPEPISPEGRAVMDASKDLERQLVQRWYDNGRLLSAPPDADLQTGFEDPRYWLTGSTDAVKLPPNWHRPHVVEVKSKDDDVVMEMMGGKRRWDEAHRRQLLVQIGLAHAAHPWRSVMVCSDCWRLVERGEEVWECPVHGAEAQVQGVNLEPPRTGSLYYASRDRPRRSCEFFFTLDEEFMELGRAKLAEWRGYFERDELPPRPFTKGGWSLKPCQWCPMKKHVCKPDTTKKIERIQDSDAFHGYVQGLRPSYDYEETRQAVLDRWDGEDGPVRLANQPENHEETST